jgi:hypothetical protein
VTDDEHKYFWEVFQRLRDGLRAREVEAARRWRDANPGNEDVTHVPMPQADEDLNVLLMLAEKMAREHADLEPRAAIYDAMREAYERAGESTKERQAAACRAGGLTRTRGGAPLDRHRVTYRWFELVRELRDRDAALAALAGEFGIAKGSMGRNLRRFHGEIAKLIAAGDPSTPYLRELLDSLERGPTAIPATWGE